MGRIKYFMVLMACLLSAYTWADNRSKPIDVIIETDLGNDIDDALALDIAYKAADQGAINILGISVHKKSDTPAQFVDMLNVWYGRKVQIGISSTPVGNNEYTDYTNKTCNLKDNEGKQLFPNSKNWKKRTMESVAMYRKILSKAKDNSVIIISLGFGTELEKLLKSGADSFSPLSGVELVAKKVKYLSIMAGSYGAKKRAEFNVINDIPSMQYTFAAWPTKIVQNPFELGKMILYPSAEIEKNLSMNILNPIVQAYKLYKKMPYNRPTWDLLSVVYVLHPEYFVEKQVGKVSVDDKGFTNFVPQEGDRDVVLELEPSKCSTILNYILAQNKKLPKGR